MSPIRIILSVSLSLCVGCHAIFPTDTNPVAPTVSPATITGIQQVTMSAAGIAMEHGDYKEALHMFREVIEQNPIATDAYLGIGDIYLIHKEWDQAESVFARASKLDPRNFDAQYGHGLTLQMTNRFIEAVRAYHRALTIKPDDMPANMNIATTYLQMGRPKSALVFAERAVELEEYSAPAQITLAATYQLLDLPKDALEAFITAAESMEEPSPQLMRNIIHLLSQAKRYREVVNTSRQLVQVDPTSTSYEQLAWASFRLGDYESSLAAYRTAVEYDEQNWRALNGVGVNELNSWLLGDRKDIEIYQRARLVFRRSLSINPDQPKVITLVLRYGL